MALKSEVDQLFLSLVESGNIRYQALPAAEVPCAVGAWAQLYAAAASPAVPHWLVGFQMGVATGLVVEQSWRVSVGYGGADGAAIAAGTVVITNWPLIVIGAAAAAMGGMLGGMLPYPVRIPVDIVDPGSRMAYTIVDNPVGGAVGSTSFRVILATAIGT